MRAGAHNRLKIHIFVEPQNRLDVFDAENGVGRFHKSDVHTDVFESLHSSERERRADFEPLFKRGFELFAFDKSCLCKRQKLFLRAAFRTEKQCFFHGQ